MASEQTTPVQKLDVDGSIGTRQVRHSIRPSLNLDFANSKELDSRITFYRDSIATYYDSKGILKYANVNEPRFDHDPLTGESKGLLIEEDRVSSVANSVSGFTNGWAHTSNTRNVINCGLAPDGTWSASRLIASDYSSTKHYVYRASTAGDRTWSVYAKAAEHSRVYFWEGGVTAQNAGFDLTGDGAVFSSVPSNRATIQNVGNGWYRCTLSVSVSSGNPLYIIGVMPTSQTHYSTNWAGDGGGILLWGATDEPGTFATSHIPSDTQFTSRASTATYFDESGILKTAPINGARHGYSSPYLHQSFNLVGASLGMRYDEIAPRSAVETGLIMETDAATNLEDYGIRSSSSTNSSVGSGTTFLETTETTAPDGSYTASKFTMTASNDRLDEQYVTFTDGQYYTLSLWVKGVANTAIRCALLSNTGANVEVTVRLTGEWQKVSVTKKFLTSEGGTTVRTHAIIIRGNPDTAITSTNGEACTYASYVYTWGIQVELGEIATSTIPTYGATATRAADVVSSVAYTRDSDYAYIDIDIHDFWNDQVSQLYTLSPRRILRRLHFWQLQRFCVWVCS